MFGIPFNWECLFYFFIVGGLLSLGGFLLPLAHGDVRWSNREDRRTLFTVIFIVLFYFGLYLSWQFYAIYGG